MLRWMRCLAAAVLGFVQLAVVNVVPETLNSGMAAPGFVGGTALRVVVCKGLGRDAQARSEAETMVALGG